MESWNDPTTKKTTVMTTIIDENLLVGDKVDTYPNYYMDGVYTVILYYPASKRYILCNDKGETFSHGI